MSLLCCEFCVFVHVVFVVVFVLLFFLCTIIIYDCVFILCGLLLLQLLWVSCTFFSGYFICVSFLGFFVFGFIFLWVLIL